jgi:hypothetical protein
MEFKRNLKSLDNKTGEKIRKEIKGVLTDHEKYQGCYFWTQTGNASSRRRQEFDYNLVFNFNGTKYEINQSLDISCKNFYYRLNIEKNGKRSNIRAIKSII